MSVRCERGAGREGAAGCGAALGPRRRPRRQGLRLSLPGRCCVQCHPMQALCRKNVRRCTLAPFTIRQCRAQSVVPPGTVLGFARLGRLHRVFEHIQLRRRIRNLHSQSKTDEPLNVCAEEEDECTSAAQRQKRFIVIVVAVPAQKPSLSHKTEPNVYTRHGMRPHGAYAVSDGRWAGPHPSAAAGTARSSSRRSAAAGPAARTRARTAAAPCATSAHPTPARRYTPSQIASRPEASDAVSDSRVTTHAQVCKVWT